MLCSNEIALILSGGPYLLGLREDRAYPMGLRCVCRSAPKIVTGAHMQSG